jgi:hypothetical protein
VDVVVDIPTTAVGFVAVAQMLVVDRTDLVAEVALKEEEVLPLVLEEAMLPLVLEELQVPSSRRVA